MTEDEKKLLQAKHRQEAVEARNRQKERKQRTRRLIQQGAILENVFPEAQIMDLDNLKMELERRLSAEVTEKHCISIPEGRTYSPPDNIGRWYPLRGRALCEADAAPAGALWTMPQSCELAVIVHAAGGRCYHL